MLFRLSSDPHRGSMQIEQVPDAEFFALEQALLAAARQPAAFPRPNTRPGAGARKLPPSVTSSRKPCATLQSVSAVSEGKKRKLPPSFAQQQQQTHKAQAVQEGLQYKGPIIYAYTALEVDYHCTQLLKQGPQAVGFDIEWRVTYKPGEVRKTALMQLCSRSRQGQYKCLLLHITHTGLTPALIQVLQRQDIHKLGVGITGDAHKLQRDFGVQCNGLVCLSEEASLRLTKDQMPDNRGLAGLCQELLRLTLDKTNGVRCSNWETLPLSGVQKAYAATDAYAALAVYQVLQGMPVITAPPRAVETAPAPWPSSPEEEAVLIVPAQQELLPLQPSKLAVYKLFTEQELSMETIASQRAVQLGTVQTYIAEAMAAGYTYPWHRMRVPFSMLASLCGHLRAYHKQQLLSDAALLQELPCDTTQMPDSQQNQTAACPSNGGVEFQGLEVPSHQGLCAGAREVRHDGQDHHHQQQYEIQHEQHQQPLHDRQGGCLHHAGSLSVTQAAAVMMHSADAVGEPGRALHGNADSMQGKAVCGHCSLLKDTESARLQSDGRVCFHDRLGSSAQVGSQRPVQLPDMQLVRELVVTSKGTKAIRDSMDTLVLSYGHMRLALAHIYCLLRHHICSCQQT